MATAHATTLRKTTQQKPRKANHDRLPDAIKAGLDLMDTGPAELLKKYPELEQNIPYDCGCGIQSGKAIEVLYHTLLVHLGERETAFENYPTVASWLREELRIAHGRKTGDLDAKLVRISMEAPDKQDANKMVATHFDIPEHRSDRLPPQLTFHFSIEGSSCTYAKVYLTPDDVWTFLKREAEYVDLDGNLLEDTRQE